MRTPIRRADANSRQDAAAALCHVAHKHIVVALLILFSRHAFSLPPRYADFDANPNMTALVIYYLRVYTFMFDAHEQ